MKAKDVKEKQYIKPVKTGVTGMFLTKLPEITTNEKGNTFVQFSWQHAESGRYFETNFFDPYKKTDRTTQQGTELAFLKYFTFARAYMDDAKYAIFEEIDFDDYDLEGMLAEIVKLMDNNWPNIETKLMVGYDKGTGFLTTPVSGWISTPFAERDLEWNVRLSFEPVENPTKPTGAAAAKPDGEKRTASDEV